MAFITTLFLSSIANAQHFTVSNAADYPYKNLVNRTDQVKVFYTTNKQNISCRVEVELDKMTWSSAEKTILSEPSTNELLVNCLSRETAKQILTQTFLQFGQGL